MSGLQQLVSEAEGCRFNAAASRIISFCYQLAATSFKTSQETPEGSPTRTLTGGPAADHSLATDHRSNPKFGGKLLPEGMLIAPSPRMKLRA